MLMRRSLLDRLEPRPDRFERQLRDLEKGAAALNLRPDSVHLALEIAAFEEDLPDEQRIGLVLLIMTALAALEEGSTRFPVTGPSSIEPMRRMLRALCGESFGENGVEVTRKSIEDLLTSGDARAVVGIGADDYKPLLYLAPYLYQQRSLVAEVQLAERLARLIRPAAADGVHKHGRASGFSMGVLRGLSDEQIKAVQLAATARLAVVSGGPGTGKTSIILAIVRVLANMGLTPEQIALAAPTGKASYRIAETLRTDVRAGQLELFQTSVFPQASTVHRLLGYSPTVKRFRYHHNNPLGAKVVIVDEASMLDLELMSRLVDALDDGARLILLGDADQLPSVSAGAVFRDLATHDDGALSSNCVRLSHSYRLRTDGGTIFGLANEINSGSLTSITIRDTVEQLAFRECEWVVTEKLPTSFLDRWYMEQVRSDPEVNQLKDHIFDYTDDGFSPSACIDIRRVFAAVSRAKMLCVTRVLDTGSDRLNDLLHQHVMREKRAAHRGGEFLAGEPIMVTRNDYDRMLFNGDQGVVLWVRRAEGEVALMAVFSRADGFVGFSVDTLRQQLELSYAMTVHKAQGSEFDAVAVILPEKDIPILSREIMYTAVSRARRSVAIVGSRAVVEAAVARRIERYSGVREHLEQCLQEAKARE